MEFEFHIEDADFLAAIDALKDKAALGARSFVVQGGHAIEAQAKVNASTGTHPRNQGHIPGTGPGPNVVSGALRRSITTFGPEQTGPEEWSAKVGPAIVYGRSVELGMYRPAGGYRGPPSRWYRRHPGFGGAYPYLGPAVEEVSRTLLPDLFRRNIEDALNS